MMLLNIVLQMQQSAALGNAEDTHKFFVPVMVIAIIFIGIVVYLISIDRKIKKLEKPHSDSPQRGENYCRDYYLSWSFFLFLIINYCLTSSQTPSPLGKVRMGQFFLLMVSQHLYFFWRTSLHLKLP